MNIRPLEKVNAYIGLQNPGAEYEKTYHNVGGSFIKNLIISARADDDSFRDYPGGSNPILRMTEINKTRFVLPLTFMNESGRAAAFFLREFNIQTEQIAVIHDDSDIAVGNFKISSGRGAAGHKGVRSITELLQTDNIVRIRIGIRNAVTRKGVRASDFVLSRITPEDEQLILAAFQKINSLLLPLIGSTTHQS